MLEYSISKWALDIQPRIQEAGYVLLTQIPGYRDSGIVYADGSFKPRGFYIDFTNIEYETMFIMRFVS